MSISSIANIEAHIAEGSTAVFTVSFKDEDELPVVPNSANWSLTDESGDVVNSRSEVSIIPAESVNIILSGDDLKISTGFTGRAEKRIITVEAVYDSSLGSDLPLKGECHFLIDNFVKI